MKRIKLCLPPWLVLHSCQNVGPHTQGSVRFLGWRFDPSPGWGTCRKAASWDVCLSLPLCKNQWSFGSVDSVLALKTEGSWVWFYSRACVLFAGFIPITCGRQPINLPLISMFPFLPPFHSKIKPMGKYPQVRTKKETGFCLPIFSIPIDTLILNIPNFINIARRLWNSNVNQ